MLIDVFLYGFMFVWKVGVVIKYLVIIVFDFFSDYVGNDGVSECFIICFV